MKAGAFFVGAARRFGVRTAHCACSTGLQPYLGIIMRTLNLVPGLAAAAFALAAPAISSAQMVQPIPGANANDPVNTLSMHLRTLAASPRDLSALLGAGQSALDVGDPNAALGFFARAEEIAPSNGRAKAGLASALVQLEKPDDALRLFGQAVSLGIPETDIAADRGLAYDLRGDNRRAQKDYALALRKGDDDEVTRRYALSLGISGDRVQAMTLLDPLLRKQDQGAWRARAFIMAMNNDVSGANAIARQVMPASLAGSMSPFLSRLSRLNPAERAHAVNFGTMPSDGQTFASVEMGDPFKPVGVPAATGAGAGLIPAGEPLGRRSAGPQVASAVPVAPKPVASVPVAAAPLPPPLVADGGERLGTRVGTRIAAVDPSKLPPEARGEAVTIVRSPMTSLPPPDSARAPAETAVVKPVVIAPAALPPVAAAAPTPVPSAFTPAPATVVVSTPPVQTAMAVTPVIPTAKPEPDPGNAPPKGLVGPPADPNAKPGFDVASTSPQPVDVPPSTVTPTPMPSAAQVAAVAPMSRLASILSGIEPEQESAPVALPTASEVRAAQRAAARKAADAAAATATAQAEKDAKAKEAAAAKANPARLWVQVATGSNERGLITTWKRIRDANEKALKGYAGYSVPYKATNRVLAGPVKSSADARTLVSALGKAGVSATTYSSEAGQEVAKLATK